MEQTYNYQTFNNLIMNENNNERSAYASKAKS